VSKLLKCCSESQLPILPIFEQMRNEKFQRNIEEAYRSMQQRVDYFNVTHPEYKIVSCRFVVQEEGDDLGCQCSFNAD
jgi:hypothetical protein